MKRFVFSLARVLKFKGQLERLAQLNEASAGFAVQTAAARVDDLRGQLRDLADRLAGAAKEAKPIGVWVERMDAAVNLDDRLREAEAGLAEAQRKLADATRKRIAASVEVESLKKLRERTWAEHQRDMKRNAQVWLDEQVQRAE